MLLKKNIKLGIVNLTVILIFLLIISNSKAQQLNNSIKNDVYVNINVLDKVSSKNTIIEIKLGEEKKFQNLIIKVLKCENSKFDDDPEITAYIQVKDLTNKDKDDVFVFNGWMFSSSPSIAPFDHPVYDIWLISCY